MRSVERLVEGYRSFRAGSYADHANRYQRLAEQGQAPEIMIIACCDSRADPALIFDAAPGEFFIVRNVANLVPPCEEPKGTRHGTSAALEFAVTGLGVKHIVILGHARCGGIKACLDEVFVHENTNSFVSQWMSVVNDTRNQVIHEHPGADEAECQEALEHAAVHTSLANLKTFPFIRERLDAGTLQLHGGYFDIASGILQALDGGTGEFAPV